MITAVDTSVLVAIDQGEPEAEAWMDRLERCRKEGPLCICDVVAAEFFAVVMDEADYAATLADLGIQLLPTSIAAAREAGRVFRAYRDNGGPRTHLIPDFLIAAHAMKDANRLVAADRGYFRRYFPSLQVVNP
jgi:predicted nucleic acid-binding protein